MTMWGNTDANTGMPKYQAFPKNAVTGTEITARQAWNNSTPGAFTAGQTKSYVGASANAIQNGGNTAHSGIILVRQGQGGLSAFTFTGNSASGYGNNATLKATDGVKTGYGYIASTNATGGALVLALGNSAGLFNNVSSITFSGGANAINVIAPDANNLGTGYSNTDFVLFSNGTINAIASITTNTAGAITNVVFNTGQRGAGFTGNTTIAQSIKAANGSASNGTSGNVIITSIYAGSGATFSGTLGGRAGRVSYECMVAMGTMGASNNAYFVG